MRLAPQLRALFEQGNFQKCSEHALFLLFIFWFRNMLCATAARVFQQSNFQNCPIVEVLLTVWLPHRLPAISASAFATAQLPKVSEAEAFLTFWFGNVLRATAACIFWSLIRPDGSAPTLGSLLFDPPEPQNIGRTVSRYFSTFPCAWPSFYLLSLLRLCPPLLLHLSTSRKKHIIWLHMISYGLCELFPLIFKDLPRLDTLKRNLAAAMKFLMGKGLSELEKYRGFTPPPQPEIPPY